MLDRAFDLQVQALGAMIRQQRRLADLSLRELAAMTSVSNAYLSQVERGLHQPSIKVVRSIADALGVAPATLLSQAGLLQAPPSSVGPETGADEKGQRPSGQASTAYDAQRPPAAGDGVHVAGAQPASTIEQAIHADGDLSGSEKAALLAVYRSFRRDRHSA